MDLLNATRTESTNSTDDCFLCHHALPIAPSEKPSTAKWEIEWSQKCSESISKLLDIDDLSPSFFQGQDYCFHCLQLFRDVEFSTRSIKILNIQLSAARQHISKLLLKHFEGGSSLSQLLHNPHVRTEHCLEHIVSTCSASANVELETSDTTQHLEGSGKERPIMFFCKSFRYLSYVVMQILFFKTP